MITEDYVSFEVAKLLKEKGFDEQCTFMYDSQHKLYSVSEQCRQYYRNNSDWIHYVGKLNICPIAAPTLQMAMKWLRDIHKLVVNIAYIDFLEHGEVWSYEIIDRNTFETKDKEYENLHTYEEAAEAAIKYCLENLIQSK